jgi:Tfp pilus assembly protein PilN
MNLIPPRRRRAKAHRRRLRTWVAMDGIITVGLLVAAAAIYFTQTSGPAPDSELDHVREQIDQSQRELLSVRIALAQSQQTAEAASFVSDQPDWSTLLAVLAKALGDDVYLDRCELLPISPPPSQPPPNLVAVKTTAMPGKPPTVALPDRVTLHLGGLARSQDAAAQFVLRLERLGIFDHVNLLQTSGQQSAGSEAVQFELDCPLRGRLGVSS